MHKAKLVQPGSLVCHVAESRRGATSSYKLRRGDTLEKVASKFSLTMDQILAYNPGQTAAPPQSLPRCLPPTLPWSHSSPPSVFCPASTVTSSPPRKLLSLLPFPLSCTLSVAHAPPWLPPSGVQMSLPFPAPCRPGAHARAPRPRRFAPFEPICSRQWKPEGPPQLLGRL